MRTRSQTKAIQDRAANVLIAVPSKPKLNDDILSIIKKKVMKKTEDKIKCESELFLERPESYNLTAELYFIDTDFKAVTMVDFLVMHTPLLANRSAVDYKFTRPVDFVALLPYNIFECVRFVALPGDAIAGVKLAFDDVWMYNAVQFKNKAHVTSYQMIHIARWNNDAHYWDGDTPDWYECRIQLYTDAPNSEWLLEWYRTMV